MAGAAVRGLLAALGATAGFYLGVSWLGRLSQTYPLPLTPLQAAGTAAAGLVVGGAFGGLLGPLVLTGVGQAARALEARVIRTPVIDLLAGTAGALVGLLLALLLGAVLGHLPWYLRAAIAICLGYLGVAVFARRREDWLGLWAGHAAVPAESPALSGQPKILDTSAIIDGRITDLYETGFLEGQLIVPTSVLDELRHMADSGDELRRQRGRYGLEVLGSLQKDRGAPVVFDSRDPDPDVEVDTKLVLLARQLGGQVVTTDFNLNKVAELQGVAVLNVNALANALRPRVLPGEELIVRVVAVGKQPGQGIGYLEDGTMVLVEGGRQFLQAEVPVIVTNVIQNQQGRMIFGRPRGRRDDEAPRS